MVHLEPSELDEFMLMGSLAWLPVCVVSGSVVIVCLMLHRYLVGPMPYPVSWS